MSLAVGGKFFERDSNASLSIPLMEVTLELLSNSFNSVAPNTLSACAKGTIATTFPEAPLAKFLEIITHSQLAVRGVVLLTYKNWLALVN